MRWLYRRDLDHKVREQVEIMNLVHGSDVLLHEGLDRGRSLDGSKAADPFSVLREEVRVGREVSRVESAPIFG